MLLPFIEWYRMLTLGRADLTRGDIKLIAFWDLYFLHRQREINNKKLQGILQNKPILSPNSDTFFIIGAGPSINSTDRRRLEAHFEARLSRTKFVFGAPLYSNV